MPKMKKKGKLLGFYPCIRRRLKHEYQHLDGVQCCKEHGGDIACIEVRADKQYGARAEIYFNCSFTDLMWKDITIKEHNAFCKRVSKKLSKSADNDKPVDTSKWVKPDMKSIKNHLLFKLMICEVLDKDDKGYSECKGAANALYSMLNTQSPKNPQCFTNFGIDPYFETVLNLAGDKEHKSYRLKMVRSNLKNVKLEVARKRYQIWKKKCLKKMIVREKLPKFKDSRYKRKKKSKTNK